MANLYDKASLVLPVSPAYKDGVIQAYKPLTSEGTFNFSRGSNLAATRVNSDGLIEKGRENLFTYSNAFDSGNWFLSNISLTSGQAGYDGSNNAWLIQGSGVGSSRIQHNGLNFSTSLYALSFYAKSGTENVVNIFDGTWGGVIICTFDLNTGNTTSSNATLKVIDVKMDSVGNGWYRCSVIVLPPNARTNTAGFVRIGIGSTTASNSGNIYIQDAQLEQGLVATDYIETTITTAVSGITEDLPRLDYSGGASCPSLLLEPQRTNILEYSEGMFGSSKFFQINGISVEGQQTDLNGTNTAVKLSNFVQNAARLDYNTTVAAVDGKTYTYSAYYKGSGDIRINVSTSTGVGGAGEKTITLTNEWVRHSITTTFSSPTGNVKSHLVITRTANNDAEVYLCFAQIEEGSYPTSYIPTYGSSVTRSVDVCNKTGISSLIGQTEGTLFAEVSVDTDSVSPSLNRVISVTDGTITNRVLIVLNTDETFRFIIIGGGSTLANITTSASALNGFHKVALAYKANDYVAYVDGAQVGSDTSAASVPSSLSQAYLGSVEAGATSSVLEGSVKQFLLFKTRLSNTELAAITSL